MALIRHDEACMISLKREITRQLQHEKLVDNIVKLDPTIDRDAGLSLLIRLSNNDMGDMLRASTRYGHHLGEALKALATVVFAIDRDLKIKELAKCFEHQWTLNFAAGDRLLLCGSLRCVTQRLMWEPSPGSIRHIDNRSLPKCLASDRVIVVCAESGAGKTHAVLTSNPNGLTVLLDPAGGDLPKKFEEASPANQEEFVEKVRDMARRALAEPLKAMKKRGFASWRELVKEAQRIGGPSAFSDQVHIVVDEAQHYPRLVRCLCRWRRAVVESLRQKGELFEGFTENNIFFDVCRYWTQCGVVSRHDDRRKDFPHHSA